MTLARTGRSRVSFIAAVLLAAAGFLGVRTPAPAAEKAIEVGQRVPEFSLPGLDGKPVSFEKQIRGKTRLIVLFFMTTACSACYEELQEIDDFLAKNPGRVDVWCVAVDLRGAQTVAPFAKANKFRVSYLIDPKFSLPRTFGFSYTPSMAILDSSAGLVLHKKGGYSPTERVADIIRAFLK